MAAEVCRRVEGSSLSLTSPQQLANFLVRFAGSEDNDGEQGTGGRGAGGRGEDGGGSVDCSRGGQ
jgi:hypothetical protein